MGGNEGKTVVRSKYYRIVKLRKNNSFRDGIKFLEQTEAPAFSLQFSPFQTLLFFTFLAIKFFRPNVDVGLFDKKDFGYQKERKISHLCA